MTALVCSGVRLSCTFGQGVSTLLAPSRGITHPSGRPLATTSDHVPYTNILPFSQCMAPPVVAKAAASGAPPLCIPKPSAQWSTSAPGVQLGVLQPLTSDAILGCAEGGQLSILDDKPSGVLSAASLVRTR